MNASSWFYYKNSPRILMCCNWHSQ